MKGLIFDIQKFSIHDGPGIRTTIFFKGCSLRCAWCHNPESISPQIELNYNSNKCRLCKKCIKYVKEEGIKIENNNLVINFDKHRFNFDLVNVCPYKAFSTYGTEYTLDELVNIVMQDKDYYDNSSGGVTFSGGEAINQIDFLVALGKKLKELGIHLTLDISGFNPKNHIEKTIDFIDLYLIDFKINEKDEEKQKKYLGKKVKPSTTLDLLNKYNKDVYLRCPIIPEVNNNNNHFREIIEYSKTYSNIKEINILPYHNMSKQIKFKEIIQRKNFRIPSEEDILNWKNFFKLNNKKAKITFAR